MTILTIPEALRGEGLTKRRVRSVCKWRKAQRYLKFYCQSLCPQGERDLGRSVADWRTDPTTNPICLESYAQSWKKRLQTSVTSMLCWAFFRHRQKLIHHFIIQHSIR